LRWLYRREGQRLLAYERSVAAHARRSFFVTENETALFRRLAPECAGVVEPMSNGVDADYFCTDPQRQSPFDAQHPAIVFTGAMDYWPNIDAVTWFVDQAWPRLVRSWPQLRFYIVGRNPGDAVRALASGDVVVTGTVADVRPYLQHAAVVVAPLRLARGIQNKILEAMAMGRPVVASDSCAAAIDARPGAELLVAARADDFVNQVEVLLRSPERAEAIGLAGRRRVLQAYSWSAHMSGIDRHLDAMHPREAAA
jgi:sugar transferase (PEP-CTERM/EpsH1 system associated)